MKLPRINPSLCLALGALLTLAAGALARAEVSTDALPMPLPAPGTATVLEIHGAIGPATARYVVNGLKQAHEDSSHLVVLELDTPGGLDSSMRDIIQGDPRLRRAGRQLRQPLRGARRQRRHLHPVRQPHRRHGAGHQSWRRHSGLDRRGVRALATGSGGHPGSPGGSPAPAAAKEDAKPAAQSTAHGAQGGERCRRPTSADSPSCAAATPSGPRARCAVRRASRPVLRSRIT